MESVIRLVDSPLEIYNEQFWQFMESVIRLVDSPLEIWNISKGESTSLIVRGIRATIMVQCQKAMSNLSNLLCPILQALLKQAMPLRSLLGRSCLFLLDNDKVVVHYGNFTIWLCHSEIKLVWNRTKFRNIRPIEPILSWRVFRAIGAEL